MARHRQRANGRGSLYRRKVGGPWYAVYKEADGHRRFRNTETPVKEQAEDLLRKWTNEVKAIRREIATNPEGASATRAAREPLARHAAAYLRWCRANLAPRNVELKRLHLHRLRDHFDRGAPLACFTLEAVERLIGGLGRSARTLNSHRQTYHALAEWLIARDHLARNPVARVEKKNEAADRKHIRRPLTVDELRTLVAVAADTGKGRTSRWSERATVYLVAVHTALRRSEIRAMTWSDVDLDAATVRVRAAVAKNRRDATLHLHPEAVAALRGIRPEAVVPSVRVFATMPTARTFNEDLKRAKIAKYDAQGRVLDLHCLRATLASDLASRVAPAIAQRALRHAKTETTMRHYVTLEDSAVATAIDSRPWFAKPAESAIEAAQTGTDGARQQLRQQRSARDGSQSSSERCSAAQSDGRDAADSADGADREIAGESAVPRSSMRAAAGAEVVGDARLERATPSLSSWGSCAREIVGSRNRAGGCGERWWGRKRAP